MAYYRGTTLLIGNNGLYYHGVYEAGLYPAVKIGTQTWMKKNLSTDRFRDGTPIPTGHNCTEFVALSAANGDADAAYTAYEDSAMNEAVYGKLYNSMAVNHSSVLAPEGWHIPTVAEWELLETYVATEFSTSDEGRYLKEKGFIHWGRDAEQENANNNTEFAAFGGGMRDSGTGMWAYKNSQGFFMTTTAGTYFHLSGANSVVTKSTGASPENAYSIRCIKD